MAIETEKPREETTYFFYVNVAIVRQKSAAECRRLLFFLFAHEPDEEGETREHLLDELLNLAIIRGVRKQSCRS